MRIARTGAKTWSIIAGLVMSLTCLSCNSQQDEEDLETTQDDGTEQLGSDDAAENMNGEDFDGQQGEDEGNNGGEDGAAINSETTNDTAAIPEEPAADTGLSNMAGDPAGMMPADPMPAANAAAPNLAAPPAAAAPSDQAPVPGGRVRYVPEGGVQVVNAPNGSPVTTLDQGEHPVTWEEAGWLKLANGYFVPAASLSESGVGRPARGKPWQ